MPDKDMMYEAAARVIALAADAGCSLGTAESCTGGLICAALTEVPGSSAVVKGGVCSYDASVKVEALGVEPVVIERFGVVSEETARAMARGACDLLACDYAVSTTGIAGPTGAEPGKPVGTVCIGLAHRGRWERSRTIHVKGNRPEVRAGAVLAALNDLIEELER